MKDTFMLRSLMKFNNLSAWPEAAVPSIAQVNDYIPWLCQVPCDYLLRDDPEGMAECSLLVQEYLGFDLMNANLDVYNFEAEAMGAPISFYRDHMPDLNRREYLIKSPDDLDKIKWKGLDCGRFPYILRYARAYEKYVGVPALLAFCAPWTLAANLYGLDNLIMDTIEEPEFVKEFLNRIVEDFHVPMFEELQRELNSFKMLLFADAFASPPMVNNSILSEFIKPSLELEVRLPASKEYLIWTQVFGV